MAPHRLAGHGRRTGKGSVPGRRGKQRGGGGRRGGRPRSFGSRKPKGAFGARDSKAQGFRARISPGRSGRAGITREPRQAAFVIRIAQAERLVRRAAGWRTASAAKSRAGTSRRAGTFAQRPPSGHAVVVRAAQTEGTSAAGMSHARRSVRAGAPMRRSRRRDRPKSNFDARRPPRAFDARKPRDSDSRKPRDFDARKPRQQAARSPDTQPKAGNGATARRSRPACRP